MNNDFKSFLQDKYGEMGSHENPDKDIDKFDEWLQQLDVDEWVALAEEWCASLLKYE